MKTDRKNPIYTQRHFIDIAECLAEFKALHCDNKLENKIMSKFINFISDRFNEDNDKFKSELFADYIVKKHFEYLDKLKTGN